MGPRPGRSWPWRLAGCTLLDSDSGERVAKSRHSPGLPVSASPTPTAASRLDSTQRLSLTTASFGLPGYRAAAPLSSGTWGNCWSASFAGAMAKRVGFSALERHAWTGFLQGLGPRVPAQTLLRKSFHYHAPGLCACKGYTMFVRRKKAKQNLRNTSWWSFTPYAERGGPLTSAAHWGS